MRTGGFSHPKMVETRKIDELWRFLPPDHIFPTKSLLFPPVYGWSSMSFPWIFRTFFKHQAAEVLWQPGGNAGIGRTIPLLALARWYVWSSLISWWLNGDLMRFVWWLNGDWMAIVHELYPPVNQHSHRTSTIFDKQNHPISIAMLVYQRVPSGNQTWLAGKFTI